MTCDHFRAKLYELCIAVNVAHPYPSGFRTGNTFKLILIKGM
jgi:hypothetical protein